MSGTSVPAAEVDDCGAATPLAPALLAALMLVILIGLHLGSVIVARHRAEGAADLAALAAAGRSMAGEAVACERARRVTDRMGVRLERCALAGFDVVVEVHRDVTGPLPVPGIVAARARAGWR
ncbi:MULTISPECIES: Rv3654c family TadE-like protein [Actinoalloteichus]|uniref:Helicase/secretion neighborhood TadE-like protein n=1 Tax=Actinoalloteichus fjordicus TaxID=1612552 RepID=A0AAC9L719_9PSEU|nr:MULTISPECIES: Rv3654c family TadE-like protein [Actinoalloteichus]APU12373.1 helicase/secretion neighborhood TadE-like protein [Actinoalloteichus fjordicus]APU18325.1 helicase/secretion neighborhood TadE-like protein [Actinoalloteichus sp. GBA129-24]